MSKMHRVLAVRVAIDPADVHVEAPCSEPFREPEQRLSLLAGHGSLASTIRPDRPALIALRAPLAESSLRNGRPLAFHVGLRRRRAGYRLNLTGQAVRPLSA
jgi:hypothetical protein